MSGKPMLTTIRTLTELKSLAPRWNALPGARRHPLLAHEWVTSAAEAFDLDGVLHMPVLWHGDRMRAVAPLVVVRRRGVRRLEFIGAQRLFEPCGLLYDNTESLQALCDAIAGLGYPVSLARITDPTDLPGLLASVARRRGLTLPLAASGSPFIPVEASWDDYSASLSSRRRYDLRRARARLEERGPVTIDIRNPAPELLPALLDEAFRVESSGWKGRQGSGLTTNRPIRRFFISYAAHAARAGTLRLCFLRVAGTAIAMQLAIQHADRWWVLKIGFDEDWADYSPGMQLTMETVHHAFERKLEAYEFLGTSESWLKVWTRHEHRYPGFNFYPHTVRGAAALAADALARVARLAVHRLRGASRIRR